MSVPVLIPAGIQPDTPMEVATRLINISRWDARMRIPRPLSLIQIAIYNRCEYLRSIRLYSIHTGYREYYDHLPVPRQFGYNCEPDCSCTHDYIDDAPDTSGAGEGAG